MKIFFAALLAFASLYTSAQSSDPNLNKRLNDYIRLNREKKFSELIEYVHPSLFTLVPKETVLAGFEKGYDSENMTITIDSIAVSNISPVYIHNGGSYHKVVYYLGLTFYMKDEEMMKDSSFSELMIMQMERMFPQKKVKFSEDRSYFTLNGPDMLLAIKDDEKSEWMFLGYDKRRAEKLKGLFPQEVVDHFHLND